MTSANLGETELAGKILRTKTGYVSGEGRGRRFDENLGGKTESIW